MDINIAGKLFPNITTLIVQLCSTGIMLLVFKKYLWSTIREYMAKRAEAIEGNTQYGNITEARQMNEQAKVFVQESEQQAREAAKEYRATIQKAKEDAAKVKEGILAEAAQEAKIKIEQADREIDAEKLKAKEEMKQEIMEYLRELGHEVTDYGTNSHDSCHYPDFGEKVGRIVAAREADCGVLICGTGVGISLAANKVEGVRAVVCSEPFSAKLSRMHNNTNVLAFGARVVGSELAKMIVDEWLDAEFEGGRHERRVNLLNEIDHTRGLKIVDEA